MTTNLSRRIIILTIPLFLAPPWAAAQPPPPIDYPYENAIGITPAMAVIFASIVSTFLLMGCLSVYARRCVDYGGVNDAAATNNNSQSGRLADGLDPAVIGSFPTFGYSEVKGLKIGKGALECAVCLSEFEDEDTLRLLPKCCHVFHQACIDVWLYSNITCPVCRAVLVPGPGETNNFVLPVHEPEANGTAEDDIIIEIQSVEPDDTSRTDKQSLPPRSTSRKNRFFGKLKRSFTTGHAVVRPGDDHERFTLRLPEDVRNRLVNRSMGRAKSGVVFPRAMSKRNEYRSASVGATKGRSLLNYERFEPEGWLDRWRFTRTPSVVSRSGSLHSPHWVCGRDCIAEHLANTPKKMSRSIKSSSFKRTTCETSDRIKENVDVGERPYDRLIFDGGQV